MEAVNREGILVIRLCDRIDSLNADDVKKELQGIVEKEAQAGSSVESETSNPEGKEAEHEISK